MHTRALYHLLRHSPSQDTPIWAREDFRDLELSELFKRLATLHVVLDTASFLAFAREADSPEELVELLLEEPQDHAYLLLFELWRKLLADRPTLSIFCDELDRRIDVYERGEGDELLQDALAELAEWLQEQVDTGIKPHKVWEEVSEHLAHDLETFLYDYMASWLDEGNIEYPKELLEEFSPYFPKSAWFELLRASFATTRADAERHVRAVLATECELGLLLDVIRFLIPFDHAAVLRAAFEKMEPLIKTKEELVELCDLLAEHYRRVDDDAALQKVLAVRKEPSVSNVKAIVLKCL